MGSGSPAQGLNPFALAPVPVPDDFDFDGDRGAANSGSSSASGGFRSRGSNGRDDPSNGIGSSASSRGSSSRRGSNRERTPVGSRGSSSNTGSNGGRAPSGNNSGSSRRTNGNQVRIFTHSLSHFLSLSTGLPLLGCWQPEEAASRKQRSAGKTNRRTESCCTEYGN